MESLLIKIQEGHDQLAVHSTRLDLHTGEWSSLVFARDVCHSGAALMCRVGMLLLGTAWILEKKICSGFCCNKIIGFCVQ